MKTLFREPLPEPLPEPKGKGPKARGQRQGFKDKKKIICAFALPLAFARDLKKVQAKVAVLSMYKVFYPFVILLAFFKTGYFCSLFR